MYSRRMRTCVQKIRSPVSVENNAINIKKATHRDAVIETDLSGSFYISTQWVSHLIARFIPRDPVPCYSFPSSPPSPPLTTARPFLYTSQPRESHRPPRPTHPISPREPPPPLSLSLFLCVRVTPRSVACPIPPRLPRL